MDPTQKNKKPMTKDEVILFVNLISNDPMVTSKETNASNNKLKEEAWMKLTEAYNCKCGTVPRTKEQLKLKWDNLKKAARKRAQITRSNMMKTGGGKPEFIPPDEILDKVTSMMGSTCTGFAVPFGGDGIGEHYLIEEATVETLISEENLDTPSTSQQKIEFLPGHSEVKKRKIDFSVCDSGLAEEKLKKLYGMPMMTKSLQNKAKKKMNDDGRLQKNLAIAKYFEKLTEKTELEILLLKKQLENKDSNNNL